MKTIRRLAVTLAAACVLVAPAPASFGQSVPTTMNYQGRLTDNNPTPSPITGSLPMRFGIWDSVVNGNELWTETWNAPNPQVVVKNGLFDIILGTYAPIPANVFTTGTSRWLEITIGPETLAPRQKLSSTGWAFQSEQSAAGGSGVAVPSGVIAYFDGIACPAGWSPVTIAEGRYLVGLRPSGTLGGFQGTPLTNLEDRPVGQHTHSINQSPHSHTYVPPVALGTGSGNSSAKVGGAAQTSADLISISINNSGSTPGTNAPYVQYLVCKKD